MKNQKIELNPNQLEQLKQIYVKELAERKSYEDLLDYVKADYYQNIDNYSSLYGKNYHGVFAEDIIYDFDEETLNEWIKKVLRNSHDNH